jgi:DNA-binding beta-propeller fold protein YncE
VFATGQKNPGSLYSIDPSQAAGAVTTVTSSLDANPAGLAFDGARIWTANLGTGPGAGSVSIVALPAGTVTTVSAGFNRLDGIIFDGSFMWVTDAAADTLLKLDSNGAILQTVTVGSNPQLPAFDGTNIWVPNALDNSISVVRASNGVVLATLTGNGLNGPTQAAFDGQRILAPNSSGDSVSLWKAADLTPLGSVSTGVGSVPIGACSDGVNFWIGLLGQAKIARF